MAFGTTRRIVYARFARATRAPSSISKGISSSPNPPQRIVGTDF
jgi:hypothetical protein